MRTCNKALLLLMIFAVFFSISTVGCVSAASTGNNTNTTNITNTTGLANSSCPEYLVNGNHTGQSDYKGPQTNTTKWTYKNVTVYGSAVTGEDGTIYVGGYKGKLYAFKPDGILKWTYATTSYILGSPAVGKDGTIYVSDWMNSTLYAINSNGTLQWKYNMGNYNYGSSPVIGSDGTIYIQNTDGTNGTLYAITPKGVVKWTYNTGTIYGSSAAVSSDTVYIEDSDGNLYAVDLNGSLKWKYTSHGRNMYGAIYYASPSIGPDGTVYILGYGFIGCNLFAIDGTTGKVKWHYPFVGTIQESVYGTPVISSNGTIYFVSANNVYAVSPEGKILWTYSTGGTATNEATSPAIGSDGTIYVGSSQCIYALNPDGTLKWSYGAGKICASPTIGSDGTLYIGNMDGVFYAFNDIAANFNTNTSNTNNPLKVQFTDKSTGTPKSWKWNFGDGTTSTLQNPTHTYSKAGTYTVTLTVTLNNGEVLKATHIITVKSDLKAPTVNSNPTGGVFNNKQTVTLNAADNSGHSTVYYTTDGSDPRTSSTRHVYTAPITINSTTTLNYVAVDPSGNWSSVYTETYTKAEPKTINVTSSMTNDQIQAILDNADPGSTIAFLGKAYSNLHLIISNQLNIINYTGTKITSYSTFPVFLINGPQAAGTKITGFTIISTGTGILINNTSNITISSNQISSSSEAAITVDKSSKISIINSSLNNSVEGINISDSTGTQIDRCTIKDNTERGVGIYNSTSTTITNSNIEHNGDTSSSGVDNSGIYMQDSDQVKISNNQITRNFHGISTNNVSNLTITSNNISGNNINGKKGDGIYLSGYAKNVTITSNTIKRNYDGIGLEYTDGRNITINSNEISGNGNGINFGHNYESGVTDEEMNEAEKTLSIKHNAVYGNTHRDVDAQEEGRHGEDLSILLGSNVYGWEWPGNNPADSGAKGRRFCCKIATTSSQLHFELIDGAYKIYFTDGDTNEVITDLPPLSAIVTVGGISYTVTLNNGIGILSFDQMSANSLYGPANANFYEQNSAAGSPYSKSIFGTGITYGTYNPNNGNGNGGNGNGNGNSGNGNGNSNDNSGNGDGTGGSGNGADPSTNGEGGSSGSDSSSSSNGASSGSTASVGLVTAVAASGSAGNNGQTGSNGQQSSQTKESKTAQELFIDAPVKNPQIWSILGIIVLLVLIFGAYYRKDLMNMVKKSKK